MDFNARPIGSALSGPGPKPRTFSPFCHSQSPPVVEPTNWRIRQTDFAALRADTLVFTSTLALSSRFHARLELARKSTGFVCVCLHALSSFQRTSDLAGRQGRLGIPMFARIGTRADRRKGNLLRLLESPRTVNHDRRRSAPGRVGQRIRRADRLALRLPLIPISAPPLAERRTFFDYRAPGDAGQVSRTKSCCFWPLRRTNSRPPMA